MSGLLDRLWRARPQQPRPIPVSAIGDPAPPDLFPRAAEIILSHEGGYVNDPRDPGGETRWGISKRAYPGEDIRNLTRERALQLYRRDYWDACRCGEMPWPVALVLFDAAVNQGADYARRTLQAALKVEADGAIGPRTMAALAKADPVPVAIEIQAQRMMRYAALPGWRTFGLGWTRRAFAVAQAAAG